MFHARFDGCLVLKLIKILTLTKTNRQTNGKVGTYVAKLGGQGDVSCKV